LTKTINPDILNNMNRTQYFVASLKNPYLLWRQKSGKCYSFLEKDGKEWVLTDTNIKKLKQITRKQAEKIFPAAFKTKVNLNPRTKKFPKTAKFKKIKGAIIPCQCHPKSEVQKVAEFEGEFFGMAPKVTTKEEFFNAYNEPPPVNMMPESTFKSFWRRLKEFLLDNDSASSRLFPLIK
jgi:hypothetical protein